MKNFILPIVAALFCVQVYADDIRLGEPGYGGSGCPGGTVSATLSPDRKALSLIFDQYIVEAGGVTGRRIDRKNCQVAVPVHIPQGLSFSIVQMDYRGFNSLPYGAYSQINIEYFLAFPGSPASGPKYSKRWNGVVNDDYLVTNTLGLLATVWSPCGGDLNLRTATSMMVATNNRYEQSLATLDSIDIKAGIRYLLQWRQCR